MGLSLIKFENVLFAFGHIHEHEQKQNIKNIIKLIWYLDRNLV